MTLKIEGIETLSFKKKQNGFTLLELIIVMFISALILGISVVFFANAMPAEKFNATVRELSSAIKYSRAKARATGERQVITIDLDAKVYTMEGGRRKVIPPDINVKIINALSEALENGAFELVFHPTGAMEGGTIELSTKNRKANISIDPIVGAMVIKQ